MDLDTVKRVVGPALDAKDKRIAELEDALRSIADLQSADEPVSYSWGLEYFKRAHKIAVDALGDEAKR